MSTEIDNTGLDAQSFDETGTFTLPQQLESDRKILDEKRIQDRTLFASFVQLETQGSSYPNSPILKDEYMRKSETPSLQAPAPDATRGQTAQYTAEKRRFVSHPAARQTATTSTHTGLLMPVQRSSKTASDPVIPGDPETVLQPEFASSPIRSMKVSSSGTQSRMLAGTDDEEAESVFPAYRRPRHPDRVFTVGRVLMVLWAERPGETSTLVTSFDGVGQVSSVGERVFASVKRFVVVKAAKHHCLAVPITTYGGRGLAKVGVTKSEHAIIYSTKLPPALRPGENPIKGESGAQPIAIQMETRSREDRLDPMARLDFGKVYTIMHNVKVKTYGKVVQSSIAALQSQFFHVFQTISSIPPDARPSAVLRKISGWENELQTSNLSTEMARTRNAPSTHQSQPTRTDSGTTTLPQQSMLEPIRIQSSADGILTDSSSSEAPYKNVSLAIKDFEGNATKEA